MMEKKILKDINPGDMFTITESSSPLILVEDTNSNLFGVNLIDNLVAKLDPELKVHPYINASHIAVANPNHQVSGTFPGHMIITKNENDNYRKIGIVWEEDTFIERLKRNRM